MIASTATLRLFGVPWLVGDGTDELLVFSAERPFQLLAFLALRRGWVRRDELAALLWPERDDEQARSNLRKVLLTARKLPGVGEIAQERDTLRWTPATDLDAFEHACADDRFDDAAAIAVAPLLQGMESGLAAGSRDWIAFERERVEALWRALASRSLDAATSDPARAAKIAEQMLRRDALDEAAACALANAQRALGQRSAAAQTLDRYASRLRSELGVEPTKAWLDARRAVDADGAAPARAALARGPTRSDADFVGRRNELAQIRRLLEQPACRLLTLVGIAGTGKSAIARKAMADGERTHGASAAWIPLEDLTAASELPTRIAAVLGIELSGGEPAHREVERALASRSMLLVLDNAEHLAIADALAGLLDACSGIKILVTSRVRLHVRGEWLLPLDGLPLPDEDERDPDVLRHCDSIRLFEARALPFVPTFDLAAQAADVARLVRTVGGSPLAIELAAAWTRVMPVADIVAELDRSLDLLEAGEPAERGLRAGFDQAWQRLAPVEKDVLATVALLPGDFGRSMAISVAAASLPVLAALVDKSMLRCDEQGRFSMHPLIRQRASVYATDPARVAADHARYIVAWVAAYRVPWRNMGREKVTEMDQELAHLRSAWQWAVARRDAAFVSVVAPALGNYYEWRGMWEESLAAFTAARDAFDTDDSTGSPSRAFALASTLRALQTLQYRGGRLVDAQATARRLMDVAGDLPDTSFLKSSLNTIGLILWQQGEYHDARAFFERVRAIAVGEGNAWETALFGTNVALVEKALGRYDQALEGYLASLEVERASGQSSSVATTLNNIANIHRIQQRFPQALACLREALVLCSRERLAPVRAFILVNLGLVYDEMGETEKAATWLEQALEEAHANSEPIIEASTLLAQAHQDVGRKALASARRKVADALAIADRLPALSMQVECVIGFGEIVAAGGDVALGAALIDWAMRQSSLDRADQDLAQRRLDGLGCRGFDAIAPERPLREVLALIPPAG